MQTFHRKILGIIYQKIALNSKKKISPKTLKLHTQLILFRIVDRPLEFCKNWLFIFSEASNWFRLKYNSYLYLFWSAIQASAIFYVPLIQNLIIHVCPWWKKYNLTEEMSDFMHQSFADILSTENWRMKWKKNSVDKYVFRLYFHILITANWSMSIIRCYYLCHFDNKKPAKCVHILNFYYWQNKNGRKNIYDSLVKYS